MSVISGYAKRNFTADKTCTVIAGNAGQAYRRVWTSAPLPGVTFGNDSGNNLNLAFARRDQYGLPLVDTNAAPDIAQYIAGAQTGNTQGTALYMADAWIVLPVGINSVRWGSRAFGTCSVGLYAGKSFRYASRIAWNVGSFQSVNQDLSKYSLLCNRRVIAVRLYCVNGYFNGGFFLTWSLNNGATYVDVPAANTFGQQPSQSQWPS